MKLLPLHEMLGSTRGIEPPPFTSELDFRSSELPAHFATIRFHASYCPTYSALTLIDYFT